MDSQIIFLGTAGDSIVAGRQERASGGIVLKTQDMQFHIDPGPGSLVMAKTLGVNIRETIGVLVTSSDWIQSNDVNAVISAMTYEGLDKTGVLITNKTTFNGTTDTEPIVNKRTKNLVEKSLALEHDMRIGVNNIEINTLYAKHKTENPFGLKFKTREFEFSYTGVTELNQAVMETHKGTDLIIIHCKNPFGIEEEGHMNSQDVIEFLKITKPKLAIITGFGIKMMQADPLYEARKIQTQSGIQVITARDGLVIDPRNYSVTIREKVVSLRR